MAENNVNNDEQLHSEKLASKESQQHTNKEFEDKERLTSCKDSEIGEGKSEETSKMKSSDKMHETTNIPSKQIDNSATGESRSDTTDINTGTLNPTEKASSGEVKPNPDASKSTEGDSSKPTEKNDAVKPSDKTDNSKSTVKTDTSKPTDKSFSSKPTDKADSKATDKPKDNTDSKPTDKSDSSKELDKTNDENEPDTKVKTGTLQDKGINANNRISSSNDTTAKALNSNSSQDTKPPVNGLTPKDIQATLAQEEEYDGLNMNSSDATGTVTDEVGVHVFMLSVKHMVELVPCIIVVSNSMCTLHLFVAYNTALVDQLACFLMVYCRWAYVKKLRARKCVNFYLFIR